MRIIGGRWRGHRLKPPPDRQVRPTTDRVREAWMSALGGTLEGRTVVDLFAGSGALGLEAASRGAEHVVLVERARGALRVIEENVGRLGAGDRATIVGEDAFRYVRSLEPEAFDLALADPPYGRGEAARLAEMFRAIPFAHELWVEHPWREPIETLPGERTRRYGDTALTTLIARCP